MSRVCLVIALAAAGCSFHAASTTDDDGSGDDMPPDACMTFSHQFDTCAYAYAQPVELPGNSYIYNTDTGTLVIGSAVQPDVPSKAVMATSGMIRVITVRSFQLDVGAIFRVEGSLPFAIAAPEAITIAGVIDASSGGAGARFTCVTSDGQAGENQGGGAGGGGGAGASAAGGTGGDGNNDGSRGHGGAMGMTFPTPSGPLGGCPGGKGGDGEDPGGPGGPGGGSVYLVSRDGVAVRGGINVGGGGGRGGTSDGSDGGDSDGGGGGGGSGGTIVLEGPILVSGKLASNGGAGGQGSGEGASGGDGAPGSLDAAQAACMHSNSSSGTDGAKGGALGHLDGETQTKVNAGAGGGGGGAVGYILIDGIAPQITGVVSPMPITLP